MRWLQKRTMILILASVVVVPLVIVAVSAASPDAPALRTPGIGAGAAPAQPVVETSALTVPALGFTLCMVLSGPIRRMAH